MGADWDILPLGDMITLQRGFDLPTQDRQPGPVPIVSSSGITGTHSEARVKAPGVVTGRYGTIGEVFYISEDFWPLNTTLYVRDFKGNDPLFMSYLLRTIDFGAHNDKSSVPGVNRNHLHTVPVLRPPLPEQRAIAHILGTLDDKIELNRRMNLTLEAMARALFQSWFVDFDPVRAKAEGRQPAGMDAATAALFPHEFEETELGEVPKGWQYTTLGRVAQVNRSSIKYVRPDASINYIDIASVDRGRLTKVRTLSLKDAPSRARRLVADGDTIWSTVRPNRRSFLFINRSMPDLVVSTGFAVLSPVSIPATYLDCCDLRRRAAGAMLAGR